MPNAADSPPVQVGAARAAYEAAFPRLAASLTPAQRRKVNGSGKPDWQGTRTFALPVNQDSPAFRSEPNDELRENLEEWKAAGRGAEIAVWVDEQVGGLDSLRAMEQLRIAVTRIYCAKVPRLEAMLCSLAIGMNLSGNANGFRIAEHFTMSPQAIHEALTETCAALGLAKPLSKINKARYAETQYRHSDERK